MDYIIDPIREFDNDDFERMMEEWEDEGIVENIDTETMKLLKEF